MTTSWLEVPTPGGDLAAMRDAERDLDLHAQRVLDESIELDRIAQQVSADWVGSTAETFTVRVAAARVAIDAVSSTHREASRVVGTYCDEWEIARDASVKAHGDIEDAFSAFVRDGQSRAQSLAAQIRAGIESLDDSVEDIPLVGGLLSKGTGAVTDGMGWLAEELIERLLSWNPSTPSPAFHPIIDDEVVVATASSIASSISSAAEWSIDRLLDGIDQVIDFIGGAIAGAVAALRAVGDALVDAIAAGLRYAKAAMDALLALGAQVAVTVATIVTQTSLIVFDALTDAFVASIDFLVSLGKTIQEVIDVLMDVGVTLLGVLVILARQKYGGPAEPRVEDPDRLNSKAYNRWKRDRAYRDSVKIRHQLADLAYGVDGKEIPPGWKMVQEYPGTDGFSATVFRNPQTGEVVIAYRGTNPEELGDIRDDSLNAGGFSTLQGRQALDLAEQIANDKQFAGDDISYTGHSLGGSLASTASIDTGRPATTFNAAGVGAGNYQNAINAGGHGRSEEQIVNFHTNIDILTEAQDSFEVQPASGAQITVGSTSESSLESHSLDTFDFDTVGAG
ncbi:hypothetical protein [Aeromicrobium sp. CF3.5]|uniref:hypothetical protein n=1 Tax=Aeromicrobium sp. CF3.5 TaxID=3373078 RepID=UPI003EE70B13